MSVSLSDSGGALEGLCLGPLRVFGVFPSKTFCLAVKYDMLLLRGVRDLFRSLSVAALSCSSLAFPFRVGLCGC